MADKIDMPRCRPCDSHCSDSRRLSSNFAMSAGDIIRCGVQSGACVGPGLDGFSGGPSSQNDDWEFECAVEDDGLKALEKDVVWESERILKTERASSSGGLEVDGRRRLEPEKRRFLPEGRPLALLGFLSGEDASFAPEALLAEWRRGRGIDGRGIRG